MRARLVVRTDRPRSWAWLRPGANDNAAALVVCAEDSAGNALSGARPTVIVCGMGGGIANDCLSQDERSNHGNFLERHLAQISDHRSTFHPKITFGVHVITPARERPNHS